MNTIKTSVPKTAFRIPLAVAAILITTFSYSFAAQNYADALYKSIYYYGAQRCGDTKSWIHAACHLEDGQVNGIDLTGGWHDCGDHVKFGQTNSYAAALLLLGYIYFSSAYEDRYSQDYSAPPPNGIPDVLDEVKIHTDYLLKAYNGGTVYYQVGDGTADHTHFVTPDYESTAYPAAQGGNPRPDYSITSGGSNVCGTAAAALALMSVAYKPYNSAYAAQCLTAAINYYNVGKTNPGALSAPGGFYNASHWAGHMAWGAIELYRATGTASYLTDAENFATNGDYSMPTNWVLCWNNCEPVADVELYKMTGTTTYLTKLQSEVSSYESKLTTCGIGKYASVNSWGNLRYTGNMALVGAFLDYLTTGGDANALSMCKNSVDFILGTHGAITSDGSMPGPGAAQGESFIVGYNDPDYPSAGWVLHPHHRAAFGKTTTGDTDFATESANPGTVPYAYTLIGSLPGGPENGCGSFDDNIGQYSQTEGGIDYNAGIVGALAYVKLKYGPTPTPTPTNQQSTATITGTFTRTKTATPTDTMTFTFTSTATRTFTATLINTATFTVTSTVTRTFTATPTFTNTVSNSATFTPTVTSTLTSTGTRTFTATYTATPTFTNTVSNSATFTPTLTGTPTSTRTLTDTQTITVTASPSDTSTFTQTYTGTPTNTRTSTCTFSPTTQPTWTITQTPTNPPPGSTNTYTYTVTPTVTETLTSTLTYTFTRTATHTSSAPLTDTPTFTVTATATQTYTITMTATNPPPGSTNTFTATITMTYTITSSETPTFTVTPDFTSTAVAQPTLTSTATQETTTGVYPNPFDPDKEDLHVAFGASVDSTDVELKLYTVSFRLIRNISLGGASTGVMNDKTATRNNFLGLARGLYYYILEFNTTNGKKYSKINELLIFY